MGEINFICALKSLEIINELHYHSHDPNQNVNSVPDRHTNIEHVPNINTNP
jgi:hypothetical protein